MSAFARDLGYEGRPFPWDQDRRALLRAELDAWYGRAYGLSRDELRYILDPADDPSTTRMARPDIGLDRMAKRQGGFLHIS